MHVYIDNSALRAINYNLSHPAMATLEKAVSAGKLKVLINSIFEGEFLKHCDLVLNSEKDSLKKIKCLENALTPYIRKTNFQTPILVKKNLIEVAVRPHFS